MAAPNAHEVLDGLLRDDKISGSAYLTLRSSIGAHANQAGPRGANAPKTDFEHTARGMALNFPILCLAYGLLACTMVALQGFPISTGEMFVYYFVVQPIAIALYHIVFLPVGEGVYRVIRLVAPVSRLPVYVATAWVLVMPLLTLIPPIR